MATARKAASTRTPARPRTRRTAAAPRAVPSLKTPLPGPKARRLLERDARFVSPSYTRNYPLVVARGRGLTIEDVDGNLFLDFTAGVAVTATGHCHPDVVRAIQEQAAELIHMAGTDFYYESQALLCERLSRLVPGPGDKKTFLSNSGTEAVECAFKLARYETRRPRTIAFLGGFHGRTMGSLSLTGSKSLQRKRFAPLLPDVTHVPYGDCYRCPYRLTYPSCNLHCVDVIEDEWFRRIVPPEEVAAIVVEPVQGEGGYVVPPPGWFERLRALADRHGILLVVDEVQAGIGRTGKFLAVEHWSVTPDVVCMAKGIASGLPLGATTARPGLMTWESGAHANTFGGNPLACRAALETLDLVERSLMRNARDVGAYLMAALRRMQAGIEMIGDVRGLGLMIGIDLVKSRDSRAFDTDRRNRAIQRAFEKGLLLLGCGPSTIRLAPALTVTRQEADTALSILDDVLREVQAGK